MSGFSDKPVILVTGATGKNGREIVKQLASQPNVHVRAAVYNMFKGADLKQENVEVVELNNDKPETVSAAFLGVDTALLLVPFKPDETVLFQTWLKAAQSAHVKHLVKFSHICADENCEVALLKDHGIQENMVKSAGIPYTILRAGWFMDHLLRLANSIKGGMFQANAGDGKYAPICIQDIAEAVVAVLLNPQQHAGNTYTVTGDQLYSNQDMAAILSKQLRKEIKYVPLSAEENMEALRKRGVLEWAAKNIVGLDTVIAKGHGALVTHDFQHLVHRPPITPDQFVEKHSMAFK